MNNTSSLALSLLVSGPVACFRRPEFVNDLITYDVMPPNVAQRLIGLIAEDAGMQSDLLRLTILKPIRSEWREVITARGRRRALVLTDVSYIIHATLKFFVGDYRDKSAALVAAQQCTNRTMHLGLTDFPASAKVLDDREKPASALDASGTLDLGWILYNTTEHKRGQFFRARMINGVIDLKPRAALTLSS